LIKSLSCKYFPEVRTVNQCHCSFAGFLRKVLCGEGEDVDGGGANVCGAAVGNTSEAASEDQGGSITSSSSNSGDSKRIGSGSASASAQQQQQQQKQRQ
jgi:hypothetical protein